MCTYIFFHVLFHYDLLLKELPELFSKTLFIYFIYSSTYLLIPNSQFIPPPPLPFPFGNYKFVSMSVSLFLSICVIFQIPHVRDIIGCLAFSFRLTSLSMINSRSIHVAAIGIISFFFMAEQHLLCSSVDGYLQVASRSWLL